MRGWLTPVPDEAFTPKSQDICLTYAQAPIRAEQGERTVSIDEMTGIQALERAAPTLPMQPGHVERRECEYQDLRKNHVERRIPELLGKVIIQ